MIAKDQSAGQSPLSLQVRQRPLAGKKFLDALSKPRTFDVTGVHVFADGT
jgi:hypothetical protein